VRVSERDVLKRERETYFFSSLVRSSATNVGDITQLFFLFIFLTFSYIYIFIMHCMLTFHLCEDIYSNTMFPIRRKDFFFFGHRERVFRIFEILTTFFIDVYVVWAWVGGCMRE